MFWILMAASFCGGIIAELLWHEDKRLFAVIMLLVNFSLWLWGMTYIDVQLVLHKV